MMMMMTKSLALSLFVRFILVVATDFILFSASFTFASRFKIIDDDLDLSKLRPLDGDELDFLDQGEDAPQIAGIIDERPEEIKKLEQFKTSSKWRVVNQDDGFNSKLEIEEIRKDIKEQEKENELVFGKMYSDSEDEKKNESDLSSQKNGHTEDASSNKGRNDSDDDLSPPRKGKRELPSNKSKSGRENQYTNLSPTQNTEHAGISQKKTSTKHRNSSDSDFSPPRRGEKDSKPQNKRNYDSDLSPQRKQDKQKSKEKIRKRSRWGDKDEDVESTLKRRSPSLSRKSKKLESSKSSQREESHKNYQHKRRSSFNDQSKKTQKGDCRNDDSDMSPPRKSRAEKKRNTTPDSDISPPRRRREYNDNNYSSKANEMYRNHSRKKPIDPESSFSQTSQNKRPQSLSSTRQAGKHSNSKHDSDSDLSPPRRDMNKSQREDKRLKRSSDSPPPTNKKMARTLEGKRAGLQNARELRNENETFRRKEDEAFSKMTDEVSGRNAQVVSRKGKRETSEERQKQREKAERQKELDEKYKKWGKGLKQLQDQESRMLDYMHEASKPLARHKDDKDLEYTLKDVERDGDPMLQYIRERKRERGELAPEKPRYKGSFPPNRFNIRPGYRWDGVDRSNGYEKKYFEHQSKRKAQEEEAYKWSTEDL